MDDASGPMIHPVASRITDEADPVAETGWSYEPTSYPNG